MLTARIINQGDVDPVHWDYFIRCSPQAAIYAEYWYLSTVQKNWMAIVVQEDSGNSKWLAVMPISLSKKLNISYSLQPLFTQHLGVFFSPFDGNLHDELHVKKKIINLIIDQFPRELVAISYNFSPRFNYFLPFTWKGFHVTPRMSYHLSVSKSVEEIRKTFSTRITNDIRKSDKYHFQLELSSDVLPLLDISSSNRILSKKQHALFSRVWVEAVKRKRGFCLYAKKEREICCGSAVLIDGDQMIFILLATKNVYKRTGVTSLVASSTIEQAVQHQDVTNFNFEGSMIESVEQYFRGFNAVPVPYYTIERYRYRLLFELYVAIKQAVPI